MDIEEINQYIKERGHLIADGATGTNFFEMGLESGTPPEIWNIENPKKVIKNHLNFINSGANIILTNTFGANKYRLALHNMEEKVFEINFKGAEIAKKSVSRSGQDILIAGSIGPTGELLHPIGKLSEQDMIECFYQQAEALSKGGVDIIWIETMSAAEELKSAIIAVKKVKKPIFCTCSFDSHGKTMMGLDPIGLVSLAESFYPDVIGYGANCGIGTAELLGTLICLERERKNKSMHIIAKANCGMPELKDGHAKYKETPKHMSLYANYAKKIGATVIGGCCGTKPEYTKEIKNNIKDYLGSNIEMDSITSELGNMSSGNRSLIESLPRKARRENKRRRIRL